MKKAFLQIRLNVWLVIAYNSLPFRVYHLGMKQDFLIGNASLLEIQWCHKRVRPSANITTNSCTFVLSSKTNHFRKKLTGIKVC